MPPWFPVGLATSLAGSPLRHRHFRLFYLGSIGAALGYTMQTTIAAWLMSTLTTSALMARGAVKLNPADDPNKAAEELLKLLRDEAKVL